MEFTETRKSCGKQDLGVGSSGMCVASGGVQSNGLKKSEVGWGREESVCPEIHPNANMARRNLPSPFPAKNRHEFPLCNLCHQKMMHLVKVPLM